MIFMIHKITILMIEDDEDVAEAMKVMITSKGYTVVNAFTYDEGLAKATALKPDMIILDVMLKGKSGFDLSYEIRGNKSISYIPILMITAINQQGNGLAFSPETDDQYLPVDEFINKPAQPQELYEKIEKLLQKKVSTWANWPEKKA